MFIFNEKNGRAQRFKLCSAILLLVFTMVAIFALFHPQDNASADVSVMEVEVSGVQLRADPPASLYYLVLITKEYSMEQTIIENASAYTDLLTKIRLYMSPEDTVGVSASEICLTDKWYINRWGSGGLLISMTAENYERYSGSSVYKISVEKDAVMPYVTGQDLIVKKSNSFVNHNYNKEEFKYGSFVWLPLGDESEELPLKEMEITGVQLRADPAGDLYYFVVTAENYVDVEVGKYVALVSKYAQLLSKIRLYLSESDTVGVSAADICLQKEWILNRWASFGIMFPMTEESYSQYNGTSVYKVVIEGGAIFPGDNCNLSLEESCIYINSNYGSEANKNGAFNWSEVPTKLYNFGECTLTNMHNRADEGNRWLFLFVEQTFETTIDVSILLQQLNTLDYIEFYTTENLTEAPITLREIYMGITTLKQFGENTAMSYTIDKEYDANKMYMLHVKPGCQIPYVEGGEYGYRVVENGKSFINGVYGLTGDIFGMFDENGKPRTYETWGVWWTAVSMVSFYVEGYDVSYPKRLIAAGDVVDLRDYQIDGYDVSLTTADDERCIGGYIVPDKDVELFLKYTISEGGENPDVNENEGNGCSSFVGTSRAFLFVVVLVVATAFVIISNNKRRARR